MGYRTVEDPSVFVRFPIVEAPDPGLVGASLLVWTTTRGPSLERRASR